MSWGGPSFVIAIVAIVAGAKLLSTWIRARHGYPVEDEGWGKSSRDDLSDNRRLDLLASENERLRGQIGRLEERIAVLERIATERPDTLSREIDALR